MKKLLRIIKTIIMFIFLICLLFSATHISHWVMVHFVDVTTEGKFYE